MNRVSRRAVFQQLFLPLLAASPKLDTIIYRIVRAEVFAFGGVGYSLELSEKEMCYRVLLARPSAEADFETVFATEMRKPSVMRLSDSGGEPETIQLMF